MTFVHCSHGVGVAVAARVLDGAALIMRAVAEGGASAAGPLREAALAEGAMLHHLHVAVTAQVRGIDESCVLLLLAVPGSVMCKIAC
jgi:hypothetical protein